MGREVRGRWARVTQGVGVFMGYGEMKLRVLSKSWGSGKTAAALIREAMAELHAGCCGLDELMVGIFDEIDQLQQQLARK